MSKSKAPNVPADRLEIYEKLVATQPQIERKGATVPYTSLNGHMFSYLNSEGSMALKLPKEEREKFLEKYQTTLFEAYGIVQKEYVKVPDNLLENTDELGKYLKISYEYVGTLKPKPTKKNSKNEDR